MKRSFVEVADSPYQLKKMIEESLKIKAAGILSNPDFQQAAALGLLEFQDNDDQLTPNLTPDELLKFFSQVVSYHDNEHPQGTLKRISSKTDTHSEEPNEDLESAYKKLFGTSIDKDPAFKHFFESEHIAINEYDENAGRWKQQKKYHYIHIVPSEGTEMSEDHFKIKGRNPTVVKTHKGYSVGLYDISASAARKAVTNHLEKAHGYKWGDHYKDHPGTNLADHLKEALEKWTDRTDYKANNPTGSTKNRLRGTPASSLSGNRIPVGTVKKTTYGAKPNATR